LLGTQQDFYDENGVQLVTFDSGVPHYRPNQIEILSIDHQRAQQRNNKIKIKKQIWYKYNFDTKVKSMRKMFRHQFDKQLSTISFK
jgi:hypothetical protein